MQETSKRKPKMKPWKERGIISTPEYIAWRNIRKRCYNQKYENYHNYGGRGIVVCEEWLRSFDAFLSCVGMRPSDDHTLERIDSNGNYEPGNVKWATWIEQANNRASNRIEEYNGKSQTIAQWSREYGIRHDTLSYRLDRIGMDMETALTTPVKTPKKRKPMGQALSTGLFDPEMVA